MIDKLTLHEGGKSKSILLLAEGKGKSKSVWQPHSLSLN